MMKHVTSNYSYIGSKKVGAKKTRAYDSCYLYVLPSTDSGPLFSATKECSGYENTEIISSIHIYSHLL